MGLEIKFVCSWCDTEVEVSFTVGGIAVEPCPHCLSNAREEGWLKRMEENENSTTQRRK